MEFDSRALKEVQETRLLIYHLDAWLCRSITPYIGDRVLEVGSGMGNILQFLLAPDRDLVIGTDIDHACVDYLQEKYQDQQNVLVFPCDVCHPDFRRLKKYHIDTVVSINVLEHIQDDELALAQISEIVAAGGHIILVLPAHKYLFGSMDRSIGHYRRYDKLSLYHKLSKHHLEVLNQKYLNPVGALGWFVNGRVLHKKVPPTGQLKLFNRLMPLVCRLDDHFNSPFGLSILSISRM
jgi:2-polyprenyl-3-methyl-5-hydroxy-6-metoxy-1,4-benzoquinol methylase